MVEEPLKFVSVGEMRKGFGGRNTSEWARTYTWNVVFENGSGLLYGIRVPDHFTRWLPATDCELTLAAIDTNDFNGGILSFAIPKSIPAYRLSITLIDDFQLGLTKWMGEWINKIVDMDEGHTLPLKDACCKCTILNFDAEENNVRMSTYHVFPNFELMMSRNSSGDIVSHSAEFVVAGIIGPKNQIFSGTVNRLYNP